MRANQKWQPDSRIAIEPDQDFIVAADLRSNPSAESKKLAIQAVQECETNTSSYFSYSIVSICICDLAPRPSAAWEETRSNTSLRSAPFTPSSHLALRSTTRPLSSTDLSAARLLRASRRYGYPQNDQEPDEESQKEGAEKDQSRGASR